MKCYVHPDVDAVGTCTNCGKSVCPSCAVEKDGKIFCKTCADTMSSQPAPAASPVPPVTPPVQPATPPVAPVIQARKEPFFSLILSFLGVFVLGCIGLGQIYNGQIKKGLILWAAHFFGWIVIAILMMVVIGICLIPLPLILWLYAMYDAYTTAEKINRGEPVKDWLS